jgi:hypothetical protein
MIFNNVAFNKKFFPGYCTMARDQDTKKPLILVSLKKELHSKNVASAPS